MKHHLAVDLHLKGCTSGTGFECGFCSTHPESFPRVPLQMDAEEAAPIMEHHLAGK